MALVAGAATACSGCDKTGSVQGRIAWGEGFARTEKALKAAPRQESDLGRLEQALSLEGVSVDLLRRLEEDEEPGGTDEVVEDFGYGRWVIQETAEPVADGSFAFSELSRGYYAVRLDQPEFGGVAYGADGTDFYLGAGKPSA